MCPGGRTKVSADPRRLLAIGGQRNDRIGEVPVESGVVDAPVLLSRPRAAQAP
jgi:hypothetical protein